MKLLRWFIGGFTELRRPTFGTSGELERRQIAARSKLPQNNVKPVIGKTKRRHLRLVVSK